MNIAYMSLRKLKINDSIFNLNGIDAWRTLGFFTVGSKLVTRISQPSVEAYLNQEDHRHVISAYVITLNSQGANYERVVDSVWSALGEAGGVLDLFFLIGGILVTILTSP